MKRSIKAFAGVFATLLLLTGCGEQADVPMSDAKVTLGSYTGIEVPMGDVSVTDEEVDNAMQSSIHYYNQGVKSDRTVIEDKDTVFASVYLYDKDGELLEDGSNHEGFITIGSGGTYPELESGIIGLEVGKEAEIAIHLPDPYEFDETLSGQTITAKVTPQYIKGTEELSLETLTDEQVKTAFDMDSVEAFRNDMRAHLVEAKEADVRQTAYNVICEKLLETCDVKPFPTAELAARVDSYMEQAERTCTSYYNCTMEEYFEMIGTTEKEYREQVEGQLRDTIKLELIFTAIGDKENIQYDEAEFQSYIDTIMKEFTYNSVEEIYEQYGEDYIKRAYRIEYIVDWLIDNADFVETPAEGSVSGNETNDQ